MFTLLTHYWARAVTMEFITSKLVVQEFDTVVLLSDDLLR